MTKYLLIASFPFFCLISNVTHASFGDSPTFGEIADKCIDNYDESNLQYCVTHGFEYSTLVTSFEQPNGDEVTFNTDIIKLGSEEIKFEHYDVVVSSHSASSNADVIVDNIRLGMESAVHSGGFSTKKVKRNGIGINGTVTKDSGQSWSEVVEVGQQIVDIAETVSAIWERFNSDDNRDGFILMVNASGEPLYLIYAAGGIQYVAVDFTLSGNNSGHGGGDVSFTAGFPSEAVNGFMDSVNTYFESTDSGGRVECRIVFTGNEERMTAQVSCS